MQYIDFNEHRNAKCTTQNAEHNIYNDPGLLDLTGKREIGHGKGWYR